jgi:hypothetical protein
MIAAALVTTPALDEIPSTIAARDDDCCLPGGRPPVPPDVGPAGPDRKNRDRIRPGRADEDPPGGMSPVPLEEDRTRSAIRLRMNTW